MLGALAEPTVRNILGDGLPSWLTFVIALLLVTARPARAGDPAVGRRPLEQTRLA
jgi:hypothetical protein